MVRAARALLSSVTRLLILADLADVYNLLRHLKIVQKSVVAVKESTNPEELVKNFMVSFQHPKVFFDEIASFNFKSYFITSRNAHTFRYARFISKKVNNNSQLNLCFKRKIWLLEKESD